MKRREFLWSMPAAGVAAWSAMQAKPARLAVNRGAGAPGGWIDGLGEIHLDYDLKLVDEIRASGLRGCVVTVGNPALQGPAAFDDMKREIDGYDAHVKKHADRFIRATRSADIDTATERGRIALVYYTQNASPIQDDLERLRLLYDAGVRIIQLTYNTRNLVGDGCLERTNTGLSTFGMALVERMNEMGILVDVSHCGPATTLEGITASSKPVAITHAGCRAIYDHPRNKPDELLRALADRGGVIGIYQINPYLGPKERNTLDDYLRHVDHAVKVAGIEHVGIGSDREHRRIPDTEEEKQKLIDELSRLRPTTSAIFRWPFFVSELNHPRRMETIRDALGKRGYAEADVDRILGGNFRRLFGDVLG
ncbi:MAG TPA: membrane dipeptidase [Vicinamibacterales bacterium]|nr:membrane dipeptidase [Vicinamibacterales bacterium]